MSDRYNAVSQFAANLTTQALATSTVLIAVGVGFTTLLTRYGNHHGHGGGFWLTGLICGLALILSGVHIGCALIAYDSGDFLFVGAQQRPAELRDFIDAVEERRAWIARGTALLVFPLAAIVALLV